MTALAIGDRVQLHPATDHWMQGDRYGTVRGFSRLHSVRVHLDRSDKHVYIHPQNLIPLRDVQLREAIWRGINQCQSCCLDDADDRDRVLQTIMGELSLIGIRDTQRPPAQCDDSQATSDTERPPPCR